MNNCLNKLENCEKCSLRTLDTVPLTSRYKDLDNIQLFVILDKPSRDENKLQSGFFSREFEYTRKIIEVKFFPERIYYTYLTKCFGETVNKTHIKTCTNTWLKHEIENVKPKAILTLGKNSFESLVAPYVTEKSATLSKCLGDIFVVEDGSYATSWESVDKIQLYGVNKENKFRYLLQRLHTLIT